MATIRKRGPYQWEAQIRRKGYPPQSKTFDTKPEADAWANMVESEMARGIWLSRAELESTTLGELLRRYESDVVPHKKGQAQERSVLRSLAGTDLARRSIGSIRSADLAALRDGWLRSYEPATVARRLSVLSHVFSVARREWGFEALSNPVELIRKPTINNARARRVAEVAPDVPDGLASEIDWVLNWTESPVLPSIVRLAVETAMRRGELISLEWQHIDLARRVAHLPATKNGSSRDVPLSRAAVDILRKLQPIADEAGSDQPSEGRVFPVRSDAVTRAFERAVERTRLAYETKCSQGGKRPDPNFLRNLCFHDLRHEAASRLANVYQFHELAKITGHKDPRMLMRYYHPRAEDLAKRLD